MVFKFFKGPLDESVFVDITYDTFPWTDEVYECVGPDHIGWNCAFRKFSSYAHNSSHLALSDANTNIPGVTLEVII